MRECSVSNATDLKSRGWVRAWCKHKIVILHEYQCNMP